MYAVIETKGRQYRVATGQQIQVDRLEGVPDSEVVLGRVLMLGKADGMVVGAPLVAGASVVARIVSHDLGDKVETFKYTRRHRSRKYRGFRASLTTLEITSING